MKLDSVIKGSEAMKFSGKLKKDSKNKITDRSN